MKVKNIDILPVFNQAAPNFWDNLLQLRIATLKQTYNLSVSASSQDAAMREFKNTWADSSSKFAFCAFSRKKLVGSINGYFKGGVMYISHLYVLPRYQGNHIGSNLINAAIAAGAFACKQLDLTSMTGAETYYQKLGFVSPYGTNHYVKAITKRTDTCQCVPVFNCVPQIAKACSEIAVASGDKFDAWYVNHAHLPMFVYRDVNGKITGFSVADRVYSASARSDDWARQCLQRNLIEYSKHR